MNFEEGNINKKSENDFQYENSLNRNLIDIKITGFFEEDIVLKEAKLYKATLKKNISFEYFGAVITGIINEKKTKKKVQMVDYKSIKNNKINSSQSQTQDVEINGISMKVDYDIKKYIQNNVLFLSKKTFLLNELSVKDNIKSASLNYSGYDLSDACLSSFMIKDIAYKKVEKLSLNEKCLVVLSLVVCCPALIWFINNDLLINLSKEQYSIFENALKIRLKHGGLCLVIKETK